MKRATELGRLMLTLDSDFEAISRAWLSTGRKFFGVIRISRNDYLLSLLTEDLVLLVNCSELTEFKNQVRYVPI